MTALVLSGSFQETRRFAQQEKLGHGIRHITSRETMTGLRPNSIHILPSFYTRRDRHALAAELKHVQRRVRHVKPIVYDYDRETKAWTPKQSPEVAADPVATEHDDAALAGEATPTAISSLVVDAVVEKDTSKDAVPGQTALEEHIEDDDVPEWMR